jgi:hypothetical protein
MAHSTYDNMWQEAMGELGEQLHVEGVEDDEDPTAPQTVCFRPPRIFFGTHLPSTPHSHKYKHSYILSHTHTHTHTYTSSTLGGPRGDDLPGLSTLCLLVHQVSANLPPIGNVL